MEYSKLELIRGLQILASHMQDPESKEDVLSWKTAVENLIRSLQDPHATIEIELMARSNDHQKPVKTEGSITILWPFFLANKNHYFDGWMHSVVAASKQDLEKEKLGGICELFNTIFKQGADVIPLEEILQQDFTKFNNPSDYCDAPLGQMLYYLKNLIPNDDVGKAFNDFLEYADKANWSFAQGSIFDVITTFMNYKSKQILPNLDINQAQLLIKILLRSNKQKWQGFLSTIPDLLQNLMKQNSVGNAKAKINIDLFRGLLAGLVNNLGLQNSATKQQLDATSIEIVKILFWFLGHQEQDAFINYLRCEVEVEHGNFIADILEYSPPGLYNSISQNSLQFQLAQKQNIPQSKLEEDVDQVNSLYAARKFLIKNLADINTRTLSEYQQKMLSAVADFIFNNQIYSKEEDEFLLNLDIVYPGFIYNFYELTNGLVSRIVSLFEGLN